MVPFVQWHVGGELHIIALQLHAVIMLAKFKLLQYIRRRSLQNYNCLERGNLLFPLFPSADSGTFRSVFTVRLAVGSD